MRLKAINENITKDFPWKWNQKNDEDDKFRCLFLPHHPISIINKPNKVKVVFKCAAQCKEKLRNNQLLPGPDLYPLLVCFVVFEKKLFRW